MKQLKALGLRRLMGIIIMLFLLALPFFVNYNVQNERKTKKKFTASYVTLEDHNPDYWKKDGLFGNYIREYELKEFRDRNAKHFPSESGNVAVISAGSIHYLDEQGNWQEIDTRIRESKVQGYAYENTHNGIRTWYPDETGESIEVGFDNEFLSIGSNMTLSWEDEDGNVLKRQSSTFSFPEADSNKVVYHAFFPGVDNEFEIEPDRVKNKLILKRRPTAKGNYLVLSEQLVLPKGWTVKLYEENIGKIYETKNGFDIVDNLGIPQLTVPAPEVYSVAEQKHPIEELPAKWILEQEGQVLTLKMQVEQSWLQDPNLKYPVVLDPTITRYGFEGGWVSSDRKISIFNPVQVGLSLGIIYRGWIKWDVGSIPTDANIQSVKGRFYTSGGNSILFPINVNQFSRKNFNFQGKHSPEDYYVYLSQTYDDIGSGPTYSSFSYSGHNDHTTYYPNHILDTDDLGDQAQADLQAKRRVHDDFFSVGIAAGQINCDWEDPDECSFVEFLARKSLLTVSYCAPLSIISQPTDNAFCKNGNAIFSVAVEGIDPTQNTQWQYSSNNGASWNDVVDGGSAPVISGANTPTLSLSNIPDSWDNYQFRYSNACGNNIVLSNSVTLTKALVPSLSSNPQSGGACEGGSFTFSASFSDAMNYQWQQSIDGGSTWADLSENQFYQGVTSNTLSILNIPARLNGRQFRLRAYSDCKENVSSPATLTLTLLPSIALDPDPVNIKEGESATFTADFISSTSLQWAYTDDGGATWVALNDGGGGRPISGATSNTLILSNVPLSWDGREYALRGYNNFCGPVYTNKALLTVIDCASPVATCKAITIQLDANNSARIGASDVDAGKTSYCDLKSLTVTPEVFDCSTLGDQTVVLTITNALNVTSSCEATVTVLEKTKPVPDLANLPTIEDECSVTIPSPPTATDNCGGTIVGTTDDPLTYSTQGTHTVTWSFDDGNGNVETQTQLVIIEDRTPPVVLTRDYTFQRPYPGKLALSPLMIDNGSNDNCGIKEMRIAPNETPSIFWGQMRVRLAVTDFNNNTSFQNATITVIDEIAPIALCQNITVKLNEDGLGAATAAAVDDGSYDAASGIRELSLNKSHFSCSDIGANPVVLSVTDYFYNTSTCNATIMVLDRVPPKAICKDIAIDALENGQVTITAEMLANGSTDNCGDLSFEFSDGLTERTLDCGRYIHRELIVIKDNNGNRSTCTAAVGISDDLPPVATCKDITLELDKNSQAAITADQVNNGSTDNCDIAKISLDQKDFDCNHLGDNPVVLAVTDNVGNTSICKATVTVVDELAPIAICKDITAEVGKNSTTIIKAQDLDNGSTDNCGSLSFEFTDGTNEKVIQCGDFGVAAVLIVKDDRGNQSSCTSNITVIDNTPPIAKCKDITVELDENGSGQFFDSDVDDGSTDNCQLAGPGFLPPILVGCNTKSKFSHTLTVKDISGNEHSCTAQVSVINRIAPIAICQDVTVQLDENGKANLTADQINNESMGNCGIADKSLDQNNFDCSHLGDNPVVLMVTDNEGNSSTCEATVRVVDEVAPIAICKDITVATGKNGTAIVTAQELGDGSTDNCGSLSFEFSDGTEEKVIQCGAIDLGEVIIVKDDSGNESSCTSNITVIDNTPPVVNCKDITVELDENGFGYYFNSDIDDGASDNCQLALPLYSHIPYSLTCNSLREFSRTITVKDLSGNRHSCTAQVTVVDRIAPKAICQDVTVQLNENGQATITADQINNESMDNCEIAEMSLDKTILSCEDATVTLTVKDKDGNESDCTSKIETLDEVPPQAKCKEVMTFFNKDGKSIVIPSDFDDGSFDACGQVEIGFLDGKDKIEVICGFNNSKRRVTLLVTDKSGNTSTCVTKLVVNDKIPPTVKCKDITLFLPESGAVPYDVSMIDDGSYDNCGSNGIIPEERLLTCENIGEFTDEFKFRDRAGNESSCTATVTVLDNLNPIAKCQDITIQLDVNGRADLKPDQIDMSSSDNCGIVDWSVDKTSFDCSTLGTHIVKLTVSDQSNNSHSCEAKVTVKDENNPCNRPPVAVCKDITISLDPSCQASINPNQVDGGSSDPDQDELILSLDKNTFSKGTHSVELIVSDGDLSAKCTAKVTAEDVTKPVPDVVSLPVINVECSVSLSSAPTATDNCEGTIIGTTNDPMSYASQGTHTITWSFDDGNGNVATQTQTVIVDDVTAPVPDLNSLPDITAECSVSLSSAPTATDNCEGTIIGTTTDPLSYSIQGTHIITWTFDDGNGNSVTQTQTVIIKDVTAPVPDVATLPIINGNCEAGLEPPFATDNCVGQVIGTTSDPLYFDKEGIYTVTWVYDDGNGNTSSQDQTIVIEDDIAPVPDRNNLPTLRAQCGLTVSTKPTATDRCVGTVVGTTSDPLTYNTQGIHLITWTFDDGNGNVATQTQRVVIRDNKAPVPDQANLPALTGSCSVMITNSPTATDNCTGSITATTDSPLEFDQEGTFAILWNYDDGNGNTSTQTQWVIVGGDVAPNALCKNISMPLTGNGSVNISASDIDNGSFDDCSQVTLLISPTGGSIFGTGLPPAPSMDLYCKDGKEQNLLLSVTNEKGNTASCQAKVTLEGTDSDADGLLDSCDNCPDTYNLNQKDSNNNGTGDACEENSNPDPNPGGWGGWSLKKQGQEDNSSITELKAFPNPFQEEINLKFNLNQEERTTVEIFNIQGQRVHTLLSELVPKGEHRVLWDGKDQNGQPMPAGIYLVRLRAGKALINQKVVLQK